MHYLDAMIFGCDPEPQRERELIVVQMNPPIPFRSFDWCAGYKDGDERGPFGWGETRELAIADLEEKES